MGVEPEIRQERVADLTRLLAARLTAERTRLKAEFGEPDPHRIRCCWIDDVLPESTTRAAHLGLPDLSTMVRRQDQKERKFVSADLDKLQSPLRDLVIAFVQQPVADAVAAIMGKERLEIDRRLYNGGVTAMVPGDFMCPHLDNSHDYDRARRRDVVLLYYLSPGWRDEDGGGLELWNGPRAATPKPIPFKANRLVIMETTNRSWHSIRPIVGPQARVSLTTYFYAPAVEKTPLRLTRFTAWPGQPLRTMLFSSEFHMRSLAARIINGRIGANRHASTPGAVPVLETLAGNGPDFAQKAER